MVTKEMPELEVSQNELDPGSLPRQDLAQSLGGRLEMSEFW